MRTQKIAFSLIELLVVVVIISILAAIAIPNFLNAQVRAKIARVQSNLKALDVSIQQFQLDTGLMLVDFRDDDFNWGLARIQNEFHGVGNETYRSYKSVFMPLTTPVSYISQIPSNPFTDEMNRLRIMDDRNPYDTYNSYHYADFDREEMEHPYYSQNYSGNVYPLYSNFERPQMLKLEKLETL